MNFSKLPLDYQIIYNIVEPGSRVLDLGCGDGELMLLLAENKDAKVQGIELDEEAIYKCVEKGLSVFHGDIDSGLSEYPDKSFDYVILNQSMQQLKTPDKVIADALRVAKKVIIGFPNFTYFKGRCRIFFKGKVPITEALPYRWYNTPNLHFFSIADFEWFCRDKKIVIHEVHYLGKNRKVIFLPNLLALSAIFVLSR